MARHYQNIEEIIAKKVWILPFYDEFRAGQFPYLIGYTKKIYVY